MGSRTKKGGRSRGRPMVHLNCPADASSSPNERIVEVSFPNGAGCLIELVYDADAVTPCRMHVYRADEGMSVTAYADRARGGVYTEATTLYTSIPLKESS